MQVHVQFDACHCVDLHTCRQVNVTNSVKPGLQYDAGTASIMSVTGNNYLFASQVL